MGMIVCVCRRTMRKLIVSRIFRSVFETSRSLSLFNVSRSQVSSSCYQPTTTTRRSKIKAPARKRNDNLEWFWRVLWHKKRILICFTCSTCAAIGGTGDSFRFRGAGSDSDYGMFGVQEQTFCAWCMIGLDTASSVARTRRPKEINSLPCLSTRWRLSVFYCQSLSHKQAYRSYHLVTL